MRTIHELIDQSCGVHNCCKLMPSQWIKLSGLTLIQAYAKLIEMIERKEIGIIDGMVYKGRNFEKYD